MKKAARGRSIASEPKKWLWDLLALSTLYILIGLVAVSAVKPDFKLPGTSLSLAFTDTMENAPSEWCVFGAPGDGGRKVSFTYLNTQANNEKRCADIAATDGPGITTTWNPSTRQCVTSNNLMLVTQSGVLVQQTTPRAGITSTVQRYYLEGTPTRANFSLDYQIAGRALCIGCPADTQPYGYIRVNAYAIQPGQEHANFFTEATSLNNKVQYQLYCVEPQKTGTNCGCVAPYCHNIPYTGTIASVQSYNGTHPDLLPGFERDLVADFAAIGINLQTTEGPVTLGTGAQDAESFLFEVFIEDLKPARNVGTTNVDNWNIYVDNLVIDTDVGVHSDQVCVDPYKPAP